MQAILFPLRTAASWGVGGYFEKRGLHLGHLLPQLGIVLRTAVALIFLGIVSGAHWRSLGQAGTRPLPYPVVGGGTVMLTL